MRFLRIALAISLSLTGAGAGFAQNATADWWLTRSDKSALLAPQPSRLVFGTMNPGLPIIVVDPAKTYQTVDGFGFALTGGSAQHLLAMAPAERRTLLEELFATGESGIGISYLRVSIGVSDLNDHTFSYDDLPEGQSDPDLAHFSLAEDEKNVIPVLKEILAISPHIKILGSPWSAPVWMKTNGKIKGGRLKPEFYPVYAQYFVKYLAGMQQAGIGIDAITIQNEPFNDGNTPSMQMLAKEEAHFIKEDLGPALRKAGLKTKIVLYDHNCDAPEYPIAILTDAGARKYVDGSGFHLYAGQITALSRVHDAFPDKSLYFTEQMVTSTRGFNIAGPVARIGIGATRNWSRNVLLWNLAADSHFEPHTDDGGCPFCQGAVTIDGNTVERNAAYYTIAHFSKFVPPASRRIESTLADSLPNVAFRTPQGKTVLIVANPSANEQTFNIVDGDRALQPTLSGGAVATYVW